MANHKSALKRIQQNEKNRIRNKSLKTRMKKVVNATRLSSDETSGNKAVEQLNFAKSIIDKAAKKGVIHKNTAARKISRLSKNISAVNTSTPTQN